MEFITERIIAEMGKLIIDGNSVYELDEACLIRKKEGGEKHTKEQKLEQEQRQDFPKHAGNPAIRK